MGEWNNNTTTTCRASTLMMVQKCSDYRTDMQTILDSGQWNFFFFNDKTICVYLGSCDSGVEPHHLV